jgi:hypothetical protein
MPPMHRKRTTHLSYPAHISMALRGIMMYPDYGNCTQWCYGMAPVVWWPVAVGRSDVSFDPKYSPHSDCTCCYWLDSSTLWQFVEIKTMIPQCATCSNEPAATEVLSTLWITQEMFNSNYRIYQDAARKNKCKDYFKAFQ